MTKTKQSDVIFACLVIAFLIYTAMRGTLKNYVQLMT